jgi:Zn-dependent M16 (insulinase) family peptidase
MTSPLQTKLSVNDNYHGFTVTKIEPIPELQCVLMEFTHDATGATVMHLASEDAENVFCLSFQTLPYNSNGVAHILEHTVLCGSKKYPVRDPFFLMTRRSLNTFMNAFTGADFTCYPAASQVSKDFYNLLEVYLDAVFHPNLNELSFLQEGHRLEFTVPEDPTTPLEYKGIVFNEMKGALSSSTARLAEVFNAAMFPDIPYGYNSGGDPKVIPSLTYQELKDFHRKYYHPSHCIFFFYGNIPIEKHLDFLNEHALKGVERAPPLPHIPVQPRFKEPVRTEAFYPISPDEDLKDKVIIAMGWLTCHILQQHDLLALDVIETILMDTDASPLKMVLLRSGLCTQVGSYIDVDMSELPLTIVLKGCEASSATTLENLVKKTLQDIVINGIPLQLIESAIHQLEFDRMEITGDHAPFGLSLFFRSALLKQHGGSPENALMIHSLFDDLRKRIIEIPRYLENVIQKYLIDNPHFVLLTMKPDPTLSQKELEDEKAQLERMKQEFSEATKKTIMNKAKELTLFQEKQEEEDDNILPCVTLDDVSKTVKELSLEREVIGNLEIFHHACFTNDIVYADLVFPLPHIAEEELSMVRLFSLLITQMACADRDYKENLEYIQSHTGGIGAQIILSLHVNDSDQMSPAFILKGKALHRKDKYLFTLLKDFAETSHFTDIPRLKEVLFKHYTAMQSSLNQNAMRYATNLAASGLNVASKIANHWYGLDYYWKIKEIKENFDERVEDLVKELEALKERLLCNQGAHLVLSCDKVLYDDLKGHQFYGLTTIKSMPYEPWKGDYPLQPVEDQARVITSPIAFITKVLNTIPFVHPDCAALHVAAGLFDNITLHTRIREQGGAYGGGSTCNGLASHFYFYSYRDPHIVSSLNAFEEAVANVLSGGFDETDLEEAKFEILQGLDAPIAPGSRADVAYHRYREGKTLQVRQAFRTRLLELNSKDVIAAVERHILPKMEEAITVVFAGKELLEKENRRLKTKGKEPFPIFTL